MVNQRLPYDSWLAASRELKAIRLRARMTGSYALEDIFTRAMYSLGVSRIPMVAALELQNTADLIKYPTLRRSVLTLAANLHPYTSAEWMEPSAAQFPDFTPLGDMHRHG